MKRQQIGKESQKNNGKRVPLMDGALTSALSVHKYSPPLLFFHDGTKRTTIEKKKKEEKNVSTETGGTGRKMYTGLRCHRPTETWSVLEPISCGQQ